MAAPKAKGCILGGCPPQVGGTETRRAAEPKQKPAVPQGAASLSSAVPERNRRAEKIPLDRRQPVLT